VAPSAIIVRRTFALIAGLVGVGIAIALGIAVGVVAHAARTGFTIAFGLGSTAVWAALRLDRRPPGAMNDAIVEVREPGHVAVAGAKHAIGSCFYDGARELLWLRGPLGVPRACLKLERGAACEIADSIGCRERGLRTLGALPGALALPFVGSLLARVLGCALAFAVAMLVAGPPRIGGPAAAIALVLSVALLRPARVELDARALRWRWWPFTRELALTSIERVTSTAGALRVRTTDGRSHRLVIRFTSSYRTLDEVQRARLASFAAFVETRAVSATLE
jgi:hypothetical protein